MKIDEQVSFTVGDDSTIRHGVLKRDTIGRNGEAGLYVWVKIDDDHKHWTLIRKADLKPLICSFENYKAIYRRQANDYRY